MQVRVVACVQAIRQEMSGSTVRYSIYDGTGSIQASFPGCDGNFKTSCRDSIHEGMYVTVTGQLQVYQENKQITIVDIRPVIDSNQITLHFLEVIYAHKQNTKPDVVKQDQTNYYNTHGQTAISMSKMPIVNPVQTSSYNLGSVLNNTVIKLLNLDCSIHKTKK